MKTVWIAIVEGYNYTQILGIFSTQEKALQKAKEEYETWEDTTMSVAVYKESIDEEFTYREVRWRG